jgi:alpha-mannosidase
MMDKRGLTVVILMFTVAMSHGGQPRQKKQSTDLHRVNNESKPLYLLTYDHGGLVLWGKDHFVEHLRSAVKWLDRYPNFKIGLDNEAHTYDQLAEESPEVIEEIRKYLVRYAGRFGIGTCTYGQPLSTFVNEESNVRQIGYALEANRKYFDCAPDVYLMSEHAMHSQIPQILKGFGFRGAIMRTHYMMYGYNPTFDVSIGWWTGLDGSRIPAIPTYKKQGAQFGKTTVDNWILTRYPGSNAPKSLADFRKDFAHIDPLLATRADDAGLRREELVKEYEGKPGYKWILLEELLSKFPAPKQQLTTAPNDFTARMPWGYCGNEIWNQCRAAEVAVLTAERLAALAMLCGGEDRQSDLEQAWKNLLVAQHHDIQICGLLEDARRHLPVAINTAKQVQTASLRHIAAQLKGGRLAQVTVYNPMSWSRADWITTEISLPRGAAKNLKVEHADKPVASEILSADIHSDGSLRDIRLSIYVNLPGLAARSYSLVSTESQPNPTGNGIAVDSENLTLSSPYWTVRFSGNGGLSSMKHRQTGQELLQTKRRSAFFAGVINGKERESNGHWNLEPANAQIPWAIARETGFVGSIPYTFEMTFRKDTPRIDCRVEFHFDGQKIGRLSNNKRDLYSPFLHEEKLRFKIFPDITGNATGVRDLPFAVSETSDRYINGLYWTALTNGKKGIALFNRGTMGAVREKDGALSMPLAYAMYYVWGTRMLNGDFTYEFALHCFDGEWQKDDLHRMALEYNYPLVDFASSPGDGKQGHLFQPVAVQSSDVLVSAMFSKKGRIYLRLYEHRGKESQTSLDYTMGKARWRDVDLAGRELGRLSNPLLWRPWQIRTVCLNLIE